MRRIHHSHRVRALSLLLGIAVAPSAVAEQQTTHVSIEIVVPPAVSGAVIVAGVDGTKRSLEPATSESIDVQVNGGRASLVLRFESGLTLTTIVRSYEKRLVLAEPFIRKINVHDSYGLGIPGAKIELRGGGGRFAWTSEAVTDISGIAQVAVPSTASGNAVAIVQADGFGTRREEVQFEVGHDLTFSLLAAGTIRGNVTDRTAHNPSVALRLLKVTTSRERVQQQAVKEEFLLKDVPPGEYVLEFAEAGVGTKFVGPIILNAAQYLDIGAVDLTPTASLFGEIRTSAGMLTPNVRIRLANATPAIEPVPETRTDARGRYVIRRIIPGEYRVELFVEGEGWQTFPQEPLSLYDGENRERSFEWLASGCSLDLEFVPEPSVSKATYSVSLPVTDPSITVAVGDLPTTRSFRFVPCEGAAFIRRTDADNEQHLVAIEGGGTRYTVRVPPLRLATEVQVWVGNRPLTGATLWVVPRDTGEMVNKARSTNVTDDSGSAIVMLPINDDVTVYAQRGLTTSIIERTSFRSQGARKQLRLPDAVVRGMTVDQDGVPLKGVAFSGSIAPVRNSFSSEPDLPSSAVTVFKGTTGADGTFEVAGIGIGKWNVQFHASGGQLQANAQFEIKGLPAERTVHVTMKTP